MFLLHMGIIKQHVELNNSDVQSIVNQQLPRKKKVTFESILSHYYANI